VTPPLFGVVGWKNSGKTTLMARLISELTRRGYMVSVVKHAHERFDIDHPGRDSYKLREAGARQVALSSPRRFALMRELGDEQEMGFPDIVACAGTCDLVLVEGFKRESFPKIEVRREGAASREPILEKFPGIVAIASDHAESETAALPVFKLDDIVGMADFIIATCKIKRP
jgi:molybdopterin-guanine dinucleotide biosynthesis adapter protein